VRAAGTSQADRWTSLVVVLTLAASACVGGGTTTTTDTPATTTPSATSTDAAPTTVVGACPDVFCVEYAIRPEASWADGTPVSAEDFAFTYETLADPDLDIANRSGYSQITGYEVVDEKTVVFAFAQVYAPWQTLFSIVLPKHVLEGEPFDTVWDEAITMGSGPFTFSEWEPGERIVLTRNSRYWGDAPGDVQSVEIVFPEDLEAQVEALGDQEVDMIYPTPQIELVEDVTALGGVDWEAGLGPVWEHFDFNQDDPRLQQPFVRQAIAQAINRDAIVEAIVRPIAADAEPLGNSVWLGNNANFQDHFNRRFPYDPVAAEALLVENGCIRGEDEVYVCDGDRLSFTWTAASGSEDREIQFEMAEADLRAIGIEVTAKFGPANDIYGNPNFFGGADAWQIMDFAWVGEPDPVRLNTLYHCEGDAPNGFGALNNLRYCDEQVDQLIRQTDTQVEPEERVATYNEADDLWLAGIPMIPMYQKPTFLAWNSVISGPADNPTRAGPFWNIGVWSGKETVIVAADEEPTTLNVFEPEGDVLAAGLVSSAVLEGAFAITPDFQFEPRLVVGAEPVVSG
jgi:peptide/nickel transport system substrate-binding protein